MRARIRELQDEGLEWLQAVDKAEREYLIGKWPGTWGDDLHVLIYGDFKPPNADLHFPRLGITVLQEPRENTVIRSAMTVLTAVVAVKEKTIPAVLEALRRVEVLLGTWTLVQWGNAGCGWWCFIMSRFASGGGVISDFDADGWERAAQGVLMLREPVRRRVEAALYWIREPQRLISESHRTIVLRKYSAYWNAFECLVEAVCLVRRPPRPGKAEKQRLLDKYVGQHGHRLTLADVEHCYREIVNPGFVGKAMHALEVCFGKDAGRYIEECFRCRDRSTRLYEVRNAINHGDVDAQNPDEVSRVQARLRRLWMVVWGMFGRLVPFSYPLDRPPKDGEGQPRRADA